MHRDDYAAIAAIAGNWTTIEERGLRMVLARGFPGITFLDMPM